ncbi:MAG: glycosyltransferase [Bacteroidetes bacterium]|nr:glycosyltransferase [Bacteroidota bacterium]
MILDFELIGLVVAGVFFLALLIQLYFLLFVFYKLAFFKKKESSLNFIPVSVIICARNEEQNLVKNLASILEQEYPTYEVVVVNDCSYDNTADILEEFANKHSHLKIVTIKEDEQHMHGKKFAVMVGIKGAKYEHLLFTDADCKPYSKKWIEAMAGNFTDSKKVVLGYGAYEKGKGFLSKLIRFDAFLIAFQYLSFAIAKKPYMGVGRNLSYTKKLFFDNKGFASHYHIKSGDDDLFVNEVATTDNCAVEFSHESITVSKSKKSLKEWMRQKRRHASTFSHYKSSSKNNLVLLGVGTYLFWVAFIALLILQYEVYVILGAFVFRMLLQMIIFNSAMKKLNEKDLFWILPILEISILLFYPLLSISKLFAPKNRWNN